MCNVLSHRLDTNTTLVREENEDVFRRVGRMVGEEIELAATGHLQQMRPHERASVIQYALYDTCLARVM